MKIYNYRNRYNKWWLYKSIRIPPHKKFRTVSKIVMHGPPSFVYGFIEFYYTDGTKQDLCSSHSFRPRKMDVEIEPEI